MAASPLAVQSNSEDMSPAGWQKQGQAPHARPSQAAGLDAEAAGGQQELGQPAAHQASPGSPARLRTSSHEPLRSQQLALASHPWK